MGCRICGDDRTVRSHIIPKAFAHDVRHGEKHAVAGSRFHDGTLRTQGGMFSDDLLCFTHENATAPFDKYAIEFVRRAEAARLAVSGDAALLVPNPTPHMLRTFALLTIWREAHWQDRGRITLGKYDAAVRGHLFEGGASPDWGVIVQRSNFTVGQQAEGISFNMHPYRARLLDRSAWLFAVAGFSFFVVTDGRGVPPLFEDWRADVYDPCPVPLADSFPFDTTRAFRGVLAAMRRRPGGASC